MVNQFKKKYFDRNNFIIDRYWVITIVAHIEEFIKLKPVNNTMKIVLQLDL